MDEIWSVQASIFVKKAVSGAPGAVDWGSVLTIVASLNQHPDAVVAYLRQITSTLLSSPPLRTNCILLIDSFFKNSRRPVFERLQSPTLVQAFSHPEIYNDPEVYNLLRKSVSSWVAICHTNDCLTPVLTAWQTDLQRSIFAPELTPAMAHKFYEDLNTALDVIGVFGEALLGEPYLLSEIMPNVREITRRAGELEQTILEPRLGSAVHSVRELGVLCQAAMNERRRHGTFNSDKFYAAFARAQQLCSQEIVVPEKKEVEGKREPVRRRRDAKEEMSVEEFFARFDRLKGVEERPVEVAQTDSLIDLLM
jgi:hypothetical protein